MTPLERKHRAAQWRALWAMQERWQAQWDRTPGECARELREYLLSLRRPTSDAPASDGSD